MGGRCQGAEALAFDFAAAAGAAALVFLRLRKAVTKLHNFLSSSSKLQTNKLDILSPASCFGLLSYSGRLRPYLQISGKDKSQRCETQHYDIRRDDT